MTKVSPTRFDEFNEIPTIREARPDIAPFGNQPVRGAISRADEAFSSFFRRVRDGETPDYPRPRHQTRKISLNVTETLKISDPNADIDNAGVLKLSACRQDERANPL
jgi:hypothetical protein